MASGLVAGSSRDRVTGKECAAILARAIDEYGIYRHILPTDCPAEKPPMLMYEGRYLSSLLPQQDDVIISLTPVGCSIHNHPEVVSDAAYLDTTIPAVKEKRRLDDDKKETKAIVPSAWEADMLLKHAKSYDDDSPSRSGMPGSADDKADTESWQDLPMDSDMGDGSTSKCDDATIGDTNPGLDQVLADADPQSDDGTARVDVTLTSFGLALPMVTSDLLKLADGIIHGETVDGVDSSLLEHDDVRKELRGAEQPMTVIPEPVEDDVIANGADPDAWFLLKHRHHALWRLFAIAKTGGGEMIEDRISSMEASNIPISQEMYRLATWAKAIKAKPLGDIIDIFAKMRQAAIDEDEKDDSWQKVIALIQLTIPDYVCAIFSAFPGSDLRMAADDTMPQIKDEDHIGATGLQFTDIPYIAEIRDPCNFIYTIVLDWYSTIYHGYPIHVTICMGNGWLGDTYQCGASISDPRDSPRDFTTILPAPLDGRYPAHKIRLPMTWAASGEPEANAAMLYPNSAHYRLLYDAQAEDLKLLADNRAEQPRQPGAILVGLSIMEKGHTANFYDHHSGTIQVTNSFCRAFWTMARSWDADPMLCDLLCSIGQCEPGPDLVHMLRKQLLSIYLVLPPVIPIPRGLFDAPIGSLAHIMRAMRAGVEPAIAMQERFCNGASSRGSYWADLVQPLQPDHRSFEGFGRFKSAAMIQQLPHDLGVNGAFTIVKVHNTERRDWNSIARNKAVLFEPILGSDTSSKPSRDDDDLHYGEYLWLLDAKYLMKQFQPIYSETSILDLNSEEPAHKRGLFDVQFRPCTLTGPMTSETTAMSINPTKISIPRASS